MMYYIILIVNSSTCTNGVAQIVDVGNYFHKIGRLPLDFVMCFIILFSTSYLSELKEKFNIL